MKIKLIHPVFFLLCLFFGSSLLGQDFLKINEVSSGGKVYEVVPETDGKGNVKRYPNIDINSSLEIKIDKLKIKDEAAKYIGTVQEIPFERMKVISDALAMRKQLIDKINLDNKASFEERKKALNNVAENTLPLLKFTYNLPGSSVFRNKVEQIFSKPNAKAAETYSEFFDILQKEIDDVNAEYARAIEKNKVYFRLGGFVNSTPVHLDGFDVIKEKEYYRVPRFVTCVSDSERKVFNDYKKLAEDANKDARKAFTARLKEAIGPFVNTLKDTLEKTISKPIADFKNGVQGLMGLNSEVIIKLNVIESNVNQVKDAIILFEEVVKQTEDPEYFFKLGSGLQNLTQIITQVRDNVKKTVEEINGIVTVEGKTVLNNFYTAYRNGIQAVENISKNINDFLDSKTKLNISITEKIAESLLKLSNDVKKIPLEDIPETTYVDLCTTGYRKEGDCFYLKAVLGKQPPGKDISEEKTIEFIPIGLYLIGLHNTINAVLMFIDNTSVEFASKKQFQLAPSYSVLFKKGSRKSSFYNNYVDLGMGVNMSTLDFNGDGNLEIGVSAAFSIFKDYVQVGYGRNLSSDQSYWCFGIRLPFLGFNLTGNPKSISKDD